MQMVKEIVILKPKYDFVQIIPNQYFFDLHHVNMQLLISSFSTPNIRIEKRGLIIEKTYNLDI